MKKTIALLAIVFVTLTATAQKKDTVKTDSLKATTAFISINDLFRLAEPLKEKVTAKQFEIYTAILNEVIGEAIREYYQKKQQP
jgi:hypothetical protein